ncbi:ABC transporter substrate-binding protein [Candidatus Bathyarchaeota archaeon]|nr:ABC transporter substrate-binding protein [Candidatus Bathyarchaeota archaeon]MBS7612971.1 ABC transporter substrate-binding protein [Candidatus Bathyarchaeota archaeon]MBS7617252.1 ABC transporter substrate-binding protein [Candidatus Bathyarchaeota archaeon]
MNRKLVVAFLIVLVAAAAYFIVYTKPWITRISVLYPDNASDILNVLKAKFEDGNWFAGVELKTYASSELVREVLSSERVDVIIVDDVNVAESLHRDRYLDWFIEFATRSGSVYCIAVVRGSVHPSQALEFVRFMLENPEIYAGLCTVVTPAKGFGSIPEELQQHIVKYKVIVDWINRSVVIPENVKKVVSLVPVITVSMIMMGGGDLLVGVDRISPSSEFLQIVYPQIKDIPVAGFLTEFDEEYILSLNPDVVLVKDSIVVERFEKIGIQVIVIDMADLNYEQLYSALRLIGDIINRRDMAEELASYCESTIEDLLNVTAKIPREEKLKVYIAMGDGLTTHVTRVSKDTIRVAGGICVAENLTAPAGAPPRVQVSMETILEWNPDVIIAWEPKVKQRILSDPRWSAVNAVKNGRVYVMPRGIREWIIPEPEAVLGAKWLAAQLYPDLATLSRDDIREFYNWFLNYTISEEEIDKILSGTYVTTI